MILKDPTCCLQDEQIFLVTLNYDPPQSTDEISGRLLTYCSKCIEGNSNVSLAIPVEEVDQETLIMLYEGGYTGSSPEVFMDLFCYPDERLTKSSWRFGSGHGSLAVQTEISPIRSVDCEETNNKSLSNASDSNYCYRINAMPFGGHGDVGVLIFVIN